MKANIQNDKKMTMSDDELVTQFFQEHAQPMIPDNGFTEKVSQRIALEPMPSIARERRLNLIWTSACVVLGLVWFYYSGAFGYLREGFHFAIGSWVQSISMFDLKLSTLESSLVGVLVLIYTAIYALIDDVRISLRAGSRGLP